MTARVLTAAMAFVLVWSSAGRGDNASRGDYEPACLMLDKIDNWRVHDRVTLVVESEGRDLGLVEIVESMGGSNPLYLAHKIWFEARDDRLCGERDVMVVDGRRVHIRRIVPLTGPSQPPRPPPQQN